MKGLPDYNNIPEYTDSVKLPAGAYEITISRAEEKSDKTGDQLCILFDISNGEYARVPVGPEVSPDSGTAHWGPGCNRACKSGWRTTGARGREPRGAGRFLPWFSGNWAGQDGKVLELARTM